jgi:flagellar motor switch protein FliG
VETAVEGAASTGGSNGEPASPPSSGTAAGPAEILRSMTGRRKAAVLLLQLDRRASGKVLAQLRDVELEELSAEIARVGEITPEMSAAVLREFGILAANGGTTVHGGLDQTRDLLVAAVGEAKAADIMGKLSSSIFDIPFKFLQNADARQLLSFLSDEHPQTIALVLAHIPAPLASKVLAGLGGDLQANVAHRIATMDRTSPEVIRQVEASLERRMSTMLVPADLSAVGGVQPLVEIINRADRGTEKLILEGLEERDPDLADEVRSRMFVFEDLINLDDRAVQLVLRQVEVANLAVALKGVSAGVRNKVMKNMSERAAITLAEEIELLGPVRVQTVEEAQTEVVRVIRTLEEEGQIIVRRGTEDEFVA